MLGLRISQFRYRLLITQESFGDSFGLCVIQEVPVSIQRIVFFTENDLLTITAGSRAAKIREQRRLSESGCQVQEIPESDNVYLSTLAMPDEGSLSRTVNNQADLRPERFRTGASQTQTVACQVTGDRDYSLGIVESVRSKPSTQSPSGIEVVFGPHQAVYSLHGSAKQAEEDLTPDEAGCAGEKNRGAVQRIALAHCRMRAPHDAGGAKHRSIKLWQNRDAGAAPRTPGLRLSGSPAGSARDR